MEWLTNFLLLKPTYRVQGFIIWVALLVAVGSSVVGYGRHAHWTWLPFTGSHASTSLANHNIVTLDLLWLANSQHAAALQLSGLGSASSELTQEEATLALTRTSKRVQSIARQIAGPNTIIVVRQALPFNGDLVPDITQQVLEALELPVNVPHDAANAYSGEPDTGVSAEQLRNSDAAAARVVSANARAEADRSDRKTGNLLP